MIPGPSAAKARARVLLADERTATLVHWPIPYGRADRRGKRPSGAKARVVIAGRRYNVPLDDVLEVIDERTQP